jgi:glutamyl-tRNA synthetase
MKAVVLLHPVRLACTGNPSGPSLYHLMEVMGKVKALDRIAKALAGI